jgi:hypothetical protein
MAHVLKIMLIVQSGDGGQTENGWTKILKDAEEFVKDVRTVIM